MNRERRRKLISLCLFAAAVVAAGQVGGLPFVLSLTPKIVFPNFELPDAVNIFGPRDKKLIRIEPVKPIGPGARCPDASQ